MCIRDRNYTTSEWEEYVAEPAPEPETPQPTQLDKIQTAQLTIMAAMADQYEDCLLYTSFKHKLWKNFKF